MTVLTVVSVFDSAAKAFAPPIFLPNVGLARRSFQQEVNRKDPSNMVHAHPADFMLYELGFFDDETAKFAPHDSPRLVVRATDLKDSA